MYLDVQAPRLRPARILLQPHSTAEFLAAKYRCETGRGSEATQLRLTLPDDTTPLQISLPAGGGGYGVSALTHLAIHVLAELPPIEGAKPKTRYINVDAAFFRVGRADIAFFALGATRFPAATEIQLLALLHSRAEANKL